MITFNIVLLMYTAERIISLNHWNDMVWLLLGLPDEHVNKHIAKDSLTRNEKEK